MRDTRGDDQFDEQQMLIRLSRGGEHGPHAIRLGPDAIRQVGFAEDEGLLPRAARTFSGYQLLTEYFDDLLPDRLHERGIYGMTRLLMAAARGDEPMVKLLIVDSVESDDDGRAIFGRSSQVTSTRACCSAPGSTSIHAGQRPSTTVIRTHQSSGAPGASPATSGRTTVITTR